MAQPCDRIPIQDPIQDGHNILHDPGEVTPSHLTPSEVEKWSKRLDNCNLASFPLSVSLIVLASAGRDAALWTMVGILTPLVIFQVYCWWRRWSASRIASTS